MYSCIFVLPVLGKGSEVSCPRTVQWKPRESIAAWTQELHIKTHTLSIVPWKIIWKYLNPFLNCAFRQLNPFPNKPWFFRIWSTSLLKTLGKGEIARNKQFLLFPVFSTLLEDFLPFSSNFIKYVVWERVKFGKQYEFTYLVYFTVFNIDSDILSPSLDKSVWSWGFSRYSLSNH